MKVLSFNPGHDGAVAYVDDGRLLFSIEAEKDSFERYREVSAPLMDLAMEMAPEVPDVLAVGGWHKWIAPDSSSSRIAAGYSGMDAVEVSEHRFFGKPVKRFTSSHERSHVFMSTAMAPSAPLEECAVLVWEGVLGALYHWRDHGADISRTQVLSEPGARYCALFGIANPEWPDDEHPGPPDEDAGKLMALAAYGDPEQITREEKALVETLLSQKTLYPFHKPAYRDSPLFNCGVDTPAVHRSARYLSDRLFQIFFGAARDLFPPGLPLVISGGCGLNCDWNRAWVDSGHFSEVFVPPCTNDTGSAIGTAVDAMTHFGEQCQLSWDVYAGAPFNADSTPSPDRWRAQPLDARELARSLVAGRIVAWVQGRCEIGPRALGHRSLLASPLVAESRKALNEIKSRAPYRPVAPCCRQEDLDLWFVDPIDDPYMLYFSRVRTRALPAVTHVDGTARVQSVPPSEVALHHLLTEFREQTGYGVLCNTSLNLPGCGFFNTMSELVEYCEQKDLDIVVDDVWYRRTPGTGAT